MLSIGVPLASGYRYDVEHSIPADVLRYPFVCAHGLCLSSGVKYHMVCDVKQDTRGC